MIKAITFDCFGVLASEAWLSVKAKYFGHDPDLMTKVSNISWQADRGLISREDAIRTTAKLAGVTPVEFTKAIDRNVPNEELFDYISELKANYKLGLLSNVASDYLKHIFSSQQLDLFDAIVLSFQTGYIKPERQAFENAARRLSVNVNECVFIDDQQRNVDGAHAAGMQAILYKNFPKFKTDLNELLKGND